MNQLSRFVDVPRQGSAVHGAPGKESDWLKLCDFPLAGERVLLCDRDFIPSEVDGLLVDLAPGRYLVEAKVLEYPGDRRISRLRVSLPGSVPHLGESLGETWTDTATTAVCDFKAFQQAWERIGEDEGLSRLEKVKETDSDCGVFTLDQIGGAVAPFVTSGFGDGTYPVFALVEAGKRVGFEVQFIPADSTYPFGRDHNASVEARPGSAAARSDAFAALAGMLKEAQSRKTGDKEKDRAALKQTLDQFLGSLHDKARAATEEFRQHIIRLRRKAPVLRPLMFSTSDEDWIRQPAVAERTAALERVGFVPLGVFGMGAFPEFVLSGFTHPNRHAVATICRGEKHPILTVGAEYADGSVFSFYESAAKPGISQPAWRLMEHRPSLEPGDLLREFFQRRPPHPLKAASTCEEFISSGEKEFERIQLWRAERGGWNLAELKAQKGLAALSETTEALQSLRHDSAETWLFNWLRAQGNLPFSAEAELERLIIIHDELTPKWLVNAWWVATKDFKAKEQDFAESGARDAFAKMNKQQGNPLHLVCRKESELAADYYLM